MISKFKKDGYVDERAANEKLAKAKICGCSFLSARNTHSKLKH